MARLARVVVADVAHRVTKRGDRRQPVFLADYESYGYDAAGNRTSLRKRDGVTIAYQYDGRNQMTVKTVPASASGAAGYGLSGPAEPLPIATIRAAGAAA